MRFSKSACQVARSQRISDEEDGSDHPILTPVSTGFSHFDIFVNVDIMPSILFSLAFLIVLFWPLVLFLLPRDI